MTEPVAVRAASTILLLRPGVNSPIEVLMVHRRDQGFFGGLTVFPGGAMEDCDARAGDRWPDGDHRMAGLRETAEEVGILVTTGGVMPAPPLIGVDLLDSIDQEGLSLDLASLTLVSRWVTPSFAPKRFDTRFYLLSMEEDPSIVLDETELTGHVWTAPEAALDMQQAGVWEMILPTIAHLRWLGRRSSVEDAISSAEGADGLTVIEPVSKDDELAVRYRAPLPTDAG